MGVLAMENLIIVASHLLSLSLNECLKLSKIDSTCYLISYSIFEIIYVGNSAAPVACLGPKKYEMGREEESEE